MSSPTPTLTKEDLAFVMNGVWNALLVPDWGREDLIQLGMAVFAKTQLKDLDDKKFARLFPHLVKISGSLGELIRARMDEAMKTVESSIESLIKTNDGLREDLKKLMAEMEKNQTPTVPTFDPVSIGVTHTPTADPIVIRKTYSPEAESASETSSDDTTEKPNE